MRSTRADQIAAIQDGLDSLIRRCDALEKRDDEARTDPPVSEAQRRAMWAAKAGNSNIGIPRSVGKEFAEADPGGKLPEHKK